MNREIWNGIGQIGDDLIADANDSKVRNHFIRRKRNLWLRYGSIAACLCLVLGLCVPLMKMATQNKKGDTEPDFQDSGIRITESEPQNGAPSLPWAHVLAYQLRIEKSSYSPSEQPVMELGYGLSGDVLGSGTLKIHISPGDFATTVPTEITVKDFTYPAHAGREANKLPIPLIPPKENAFGTVEIRFLFYPDNTESAEYAAYLADGALPLGTISLSYVVNEYEIVFSQRSAYDLFELRLVGLYESGTISAKEFADRYFTVAYRDTICASVSVLNPDGSYKFIYRSKNIRYDSP
ncbi:MAG: hypothetical protein SPJ23_03980, partial [Eubacteriales bacterium]|nr:hypothetical protein [Eubacteriales bacterium]